MKPPPDLVKWPNLDAKWSDRDLASAQLIDALCLENIYLFQDHDPPRVPQSLSLIEALALETYIGVSFPENDDVRSPLPSIVQLWFLLRDLEYDS